MADKRVQVRVIRKFHDGWLCAEAVTLSVFEQLKVEPDSQVIRAVSAMNFGMGGTGAEHCGAFTGGVATLGCFLGRHKPGIELRELHQEVAAFRQWFLEKHGTLNCEELVDSFGDQRKTECVGLAATAAEYLVGRKERLVGADRKSDGERRCVEQGQCPFSG